MVRVPGLALLYFDPVRVRSRETADQPVVRAFLAQHHSTRVARRGELLDPLEHPALMAVSGDGRLLGILTYVPGQDWEQCEILTLHTAAQWQGAGSALIGSAEQLAAHHGCSRLWLITTNDNVDALRFYQRRGYRLAALHRGGVDASRRRLKPGIPLAGSYGIPLHDELELDKRLDMTPAAARPTARMA